MKVNIFINIKNNNNIILNFILIKGLSEIQIFYTVFK